MVKTAVFNSRLVMDAWVKKNSGFITVLSVGSPKVSFGYDTPIMLQYPQIEVTYLEFTRSI